MRKISSLKVLILLIASFIFSASFAQNRRVTGTVLDDKQTPLVGATVSVKGSTVATTTDATGKFSFNVPSNARTLVVTYVGMQQQEVSISDRDNVTVALASSQGALSDVVVVGYGRARRANLTSAQTSVSAKEIEKTVNTTVEQAIQGRAAGVYVTQNSGQPGGGISVNIRGISSLGRTQPLYVIDGVQIQSNEDVSFGYTSSSNPLAGLNPSDIEDIQILQGPSATAIYGSRATNGVVLVTTKRGRAGDFRIGYAYQYNLQMTPQNLPVMNLRQYAQMVNEYKAIAGGTVQAEFLDPSLLGEGTNWQNELFNNAAMKKHQLNFSGGSNNTTYYMSGEYLDQEGVALGSGFKRYGVRLNLDNKPREWATIGANLSFNQTNENLTATNYTDAASPLIANALRLTPQIPVVNLNGTWGGADPINGANQFTLVNPIALARLITNNSIRRQFLGGVNLGITPLKGLSLRTSLNGNVGNGSNNYYTPTYSIDQWHEQKIAKLEVNNNQSWYWNWNQLAEYTRQFDKHNLTVMASHESQESKYQAFYLERQGFLTNDILDVNAGDPLTAKNGGGTYPWAMESYLGRLNYNFDNRYLLTATYRRDGSPYFGQDKRWGSFPSVSAAWRVSREKFFNVPAISELKLRYEYGFTGNQGTGSGIYADMSSWATSWGTGFLPSTFTNPLLQWEETKTNNAGLNLGLFNNRVSVEADYYVKKTSNLILSASLPWYMGTSNANAAVRPPLVNTGDLQTNGWNLTFITTNINTKNFRWESNLNLSHFMSTVNQLYQNSQFVFREGLWFLPNWTQRSYLGKQPWLFMGYETDGLFQTLEDISKSPRPIDNAGNPIPINAQTGLWVGDVKYKDINADGKIDQNDMTIIGNPWPKLTGGFTNTFSFKGLELSMLITGSYGNDVYNYIAADASNPNNINLSRNLLVKAMEYAKLTTDGSGNPILSNPETTVPRISTNQVSSDNNFSKISDRFVEDGSYLRLKNVSLSYNLPANLLGYTKIFKGLKATIGAQNLYTLTKYKGYDPEIGAYVGMGVTSTQQPIGLDFGRYPSTPMFTGSLSVNF